MNSNASNNRSNKIKKNIGFSFVFKGIDAAVQLLLVPVTLGYLNQYEYGVWLTLNSILLWINSFDIGLGNGLRNKLAEAVAKKNFSLARILVSTAFGMIVLLMGAIFVLGSIVVFNVDWYSVLGTTQDIVPSLFNVVYISFAIFCFHLVFKFIGNIYLAMQMPSINNLMIMAGHILSLLIIYVLTKTTDGNLLYVAVTFSLSPVIIYFFAIPITFLFVYKPLTPSIRLFRKKELSGLFNMGLLFFLLQVSGIIIFAFSNILISNLFGPDHVTPFNIAFRYFSLVNMILAIIVSPLWSAVTDAYAQGDISWIKISLQKIDYLLMLFAFGLAVMVGISRFVYKIWIGTDVDIPYTISALTACYVFITVCSTAYSYILNGLGKLRVQIINTVSVAVLFLPLCYMFGKTMGLNGVIIGMALLNLSGAILNRIQVNKILFGSAEGIWNK